MLRMVLAWVVLMVLAGNAMASIVAPCADGHCQKVGSLLDGPDRHAPAGDNEPHPCAAHHCHAHAYDRLGVVAVPVAGLATTAVPVITPVDQLIAGISHQPPVQPPSFL